MSLDGKQGRAHDAAMTAGPWTGEPESELFFATVEAQNELDPDHVLIAPMGVIDRGASATARCGWRRRGPTENGDANAAGIAWMRNNLRDLLDAAGGRDRLQAEVKRLGGLLADARWDLMP